MNGLIADLIFLVENRSKPAASRIQILSPPVFLFEGCKIYRLHLELPWVPLALNKTLTKHWRRRHATNKQWDAYIAAYVHGKKPPRPLEHARIRLVRHSARKLDFDGLTGSLKPVVDALVSAGVLKDDSWRVLGRWDPDQADRPAKDGQLLEIILEEIPAGVDRGALPPL